MNKVQVRYSDKKNKSLPLIIINLGLHDQSDNPPALLLRAKAFLGVLVLNSSANSITANSSY